MITNLNHLFLKQTQEEFNHALEKYNEADPNISWPIKSILYVALCDFDASAEDPKDNIIGLSKREEVEVLEKNETGERKVFLFMLQNFQVYNVNYIYFDTLSTCR